MEKKILAKVGQKEITNLDVQSAIQGLDPYQAQQFQTEEGQKYVLDDLINQELLYMYAKDNKIDQDEQFRNEMKRVEENVLKQYVINKILTSVKLTEEEKKAFYEAQKQSFSKPETANAKHILVDSEEKANDILGKINAGDVSFEDAAKEHSTCPSKNNGGDLGTFGRGQMVPEFEEAVFNMNNGEVSGPVKTQFGYHLIKLENKNESSIPAYDEVAEEVGKTLLFQRQGEVYQQKLNEVKEKYPNLMYFDEAVNNLKITNEQPFYINKDNQVVVVFNQFEIAPGYMSLPEFIIK